MNPRALRTREFRYRAFGERITTYGGAPGRTDPSFQNRTYDSGLGIYDYRNRCFDPSTGRFLQRDPVLGGDPLYNPYCFPGNNPVTNADPMGHSVWRTAWQVLKVTAKTGYTELMRVSRRGKKGTVKAVKDALGEAAEGERRIVVAETEEARDALGQALAENKKIRGPESSPGYPEHIHPQSGPYKDVHIQTELPGKKGKSQGQAVKKSSSGAKAFGAALMMAVAPLSSEQAERVKQRDPEVTTSGIMGAAYCDLIISLDPTGITDFFALASGSPVDDAILRQYGLMPGQDPSVEWEFTVGSQRTKPSAKSVERENVQLLLDIYELSKKLRAAETGTKDKLKGSEESGTHYDAPMPVPSRRDILEQKLRQLEEQERFGQPIYSDLGELASAIRTPELCSVPKLVECAEHKQRIGLEEIRHAASDELES